MRAVADKINGRWVVLYDSMNLLSVHHDGNITWDELQDIKNSVWGPYACAIEVYPAHGDVVNAANIRHLWKLEDGDFRPHLLGPPLGGAGPSLYDKLRLAWGEAEEIFKEPT